MMGETSTNEDVLLIVEKTRDSQRIRVETERHRANFRLTHTEFLQRGKL
jgi:hypothetical protein